VRSWSNPDSVIPRQTLSRASRRGRQLGPCLWPAVRIPRPASASVFGLLHCYIAEWMQSRLAYIIGGCFAHSSPRRARW
jgi:hypothetical protein